MSRNLSRSARACKAVKSHPILVESLESRRLLTTLLFLANGVMTIHEDASGVANTTTIKVIDDVGTIEVDETPHDLNENQQLYSDGWRVATNFDTASGPGSVISSIVIDTGDGNDVFNVPNLDTPVVIQPSGPGVDEVDVGSEQSPDGAQAVTQPITFNATNSSDPILLVDDDKDTGNVDPTLTSSSILGLAGAAVNFTVASHPESGVPQMTVDCFPGSGTSGFVVAQDPGDSSAIRYTVQKTLGPDTISVQTLSAKSEVQLQPQSGASERVFLGSQGLLSGVKGSVDAFFQGGSTGTIVANDSADTTGHNFGIQSSPDSLTEDGRTVATWNDQLTAFTLQTGTAQNTVTVVYGENPPGGITTTVQSGGSDSIKVRETPPNMILDLVGGTGVGNVSIDGFFVDGRIQISNPTGQEAVSIDASFAKTSQAISVTDSTVTGLSFTSLSMANLKSLSVVGGTVFDNFSVTPSATAAITIDGGPDSGTPTDRMDVDTSKVTGTELTVQDGTDGEQGSYSFTNRQPVNFTRLGEITPTFDDLKGTVYNEQDGQPVAGTTVVVDTNNNGIVDAGEPTSTTAADGSFSFTALPTGTLGVLLQSNTLSLVAPISVTLAAGVLQAPLSVAVAPVVTAGGPDLIVSVNATGGKSATSKPKVTVKITNIGAAMTAATSVEILLFASADKSLDPLDSKLLSFNTPLLNLKTKASKTFTATGSAAISLLTGRYFIVASVDGQNAVAESDEANNVGASSKQVLLAPPLADLTGKFGATPKSASKSKLLTIPLTLQNTGTIAAGGTIEVDFFASADKTLDDTDVQIGSGFPLSAHLGAGRSQSAKFKLSLVSIPAGSHFIIARINSTHVINEASFDNNVFSSAAPITIS